jgi:hypothetical protein
MKKQNTVVTSSLAVVGLFLSTGSIAASPFDEGPSDSSIKECVAQIADQANYDDAAGVRHEVATKERKVSGHLLMIDTKVYDQINGEVVREYAATCVVGRNGNQLSFKIKQIDTEV